MRELEKISAGNKQLIGLSYWSFGLGFGPFIPLAAAWIFRKNHFVSHQLIQSMFLQTIFSLVSTALFFILVIHTYQQGPILQTTPFGLLIFTLKGTVDWSGRIICFIISLFCFKRGYLFIPFVKSFSERFLSFFYKISLKKVIVLSIVWPGFGHLFIGKSFFGWIISLSHLVTVLSLGYLSLAACNFSAAKDVLTVMGFYLRIDDQSFQEGFTNSLAIGLLAFVFVLNYFTTFINLPIYRAIKKVQRTYFASLNCSYIIHIGILWCILLLPFVLNSKTSKESIEAQAKKIYKDLIDLDKKQRLSIKRNEKQQEREMRFDLELPRKIEGTNEFSPKPFNQEFFKDKNTFDAPTIGFEQLKRPLPSKKSYIEKQSRESKSYSEYLTAKVREGARDQIIWKKAPNHYSVILRYTISSRGYISDIQIIEGSGNLQMDALVISVVKSMSPFVKPQNQRGLVVTELFWNTHGTNGLDTELKRSLATYPDGRVIESI